MALVIFKPPFLQGAWRSPGGAVGLCSGGSAPPGQSRTRRQRCPRESHLTHLSPCWRLPGFQLELSKARLFFMPVLIPLSFHRIPKNPCRERGDYPCARAGQRPRLRAAPLAGAGRCRLIYTPASTHGTCQRGHQPGPVCPRRYAPSFGPCWGDGALGARRRARGWS